MAGLPMHETMAESQPIRILQVLTIMNRGGAENMIMNYYRQMDRSKVQFDFLLHRKEDGAFDAEIRELGGVIYKLDPIHPGSYSKYKRDLMEFFQRHPEYNMVHSHLNALSFMVLAAAKEAGIRVRIAHSHTAVDPRSLMKLFKANTDRKAILKNYVQHLLRYKVRKTATHYFACGEVAGHWLFGKQNRKRVQIINNAIDASLYTFDPALRNEVRSQLKLGNAITYGHVGLFKEEKNHFYLLDVFRALHQSNPNSKLLLVGDGPLMPAIKSRTTEYGLEDAVVFTGMRKDVPILLQAMDYFVFPSIYEGFPVTLVEAEASGLKIYCSDRVTREVNLSGSIDFLSISQNPGYWARFILDNPKVQREDTGNIIRKAGYDIKANAMALQEFYLSKANH